MTRGLAGKDDLGGKLVAVVGRTITQTGRLNAQIIDRNINRGLPRRVRVTQRAVFDRQMRDINWEKIIDYFLPAPVGGKLSAGFGGTADEINPPVRNDNIAHKFAVKKLPPGEREFNLTGGEKWFLHFTLALGDFDVRDPIGAPPYLQINITHPACIARDFTQPLVDCVPDVIRRSQAQHQQGKR